MVSDKDVVSRCVEAKRNTSNDRLRRTLEYTERIDLKNGGYQLAKRRVSYRIRPYTGALHLFAATKHMRHPFKKHIYIIDADPRHSVMREIRSFFVHVVCRKHAATFFVTTSETIQFFAFERS